MSKFKVIYEDDYLLIVDKPSGFTVNKAETTVNEETLQDFVEDYLSFASKNAQTDKLSDFYKRAGIVHRIDKETSGIIVVAKTMESFVSLQQQFKQRIVEKIYVALVHGLIEHEGEISVPVGRLPWNRKRFGVLAGGKDSLTKYKVLDILYFVQDKVKEALTLLELYPKTGRTHQIRVHLKYINHPIFADPLYAGRKVSRNDRKYLQRVFLHAKKISFNHPKSGDRVEFVSELPQELSNFLDGLERRV